MPKRNTNSGSSVAFSMQPAHNKLVPPGGKYRHTLNLMSLAYNVVQSHGIPHYNEGRLFVHQPWLQLSLDYHSPLITIVP